MILEVFSSSEYILQKILVQIFLKLVFVLIADRDIGFSENNTAILDKVNSGIFLKQNFVVLV